MSTARMRRLLVLNLAVDLDDPILRFTSDWLRGLSQHVERIDVVTMTEGRHDLPAQVGVHSIGKERGLSEPRRLLKFYRLLIRLTKRHRYDACLVHMVPLFAVLATPVLRARRIRTTLWYSHGAAPPALRAAVRSVHKVVTPTRESFPLQTPKLQVVGHGVPSGWYYPDDRPPREPGTEMRLVTIGRISPVKQLEQLIDATVLAQRSSCTHSFTLRIVGPPLDLQYLRALRSRVRCHGAQSYIRFVGPLDAAGVRRELWDADVFLGASRSDSLDKSMLEAMACALPVLYSNRSAEALLAECCPELRVEVGAEPPSFARRLIELSEMSVPNRKELGRRLRARVQAEHDLDRLCRLLVYDIL